MTKNIQIRVQPKTASDAAAVRNKVADTLGVKPADVTAVVVRHRSIDARQRTVMVNLGVEVYLHGEKPVNDFQPIEYQDVSDRETVVVVGAGPGGLFAALRLIELGFRPVVLERGRDVDSRKKDIALISREHLVNPESNYSFGEGGAGAYSDGKLYTRSKKRGNVEKILRVFVQHGASPDILVDAHPHIGTDRLPSIIKAMREQIKKSGGEVHFRSRVDEIIIENDTCKGVIFNDLDTDEQHEVRSRAVILATGHSARDIYRHLHEKHVEIEPKGIAVGVRLEHPSELIDRLQYHNKDGRGKYLPAAEYAFVQQVEDRGVYSFCMCPGGFVVPAASGPGQVVVNGMSPSGRNGRWSNSGMVVETRVEDVEGDDPLRMMRYQEELERMAWMQGGRTQTAPAQRMADFVSGRLSAELPHSSYSPGLLASPLHFWMPQSISQRLREGFKAFDRRCRGFLTNEAILIAMETRTSAPVRILRDNDTLQHVRIKGLFPCGEGAGYAGGIVSAAIDGERCAEKVSNVNKS